MRTFLLIICFSIFTAPAFARGSHTTEPVLGDIARTMIAFLQQQHYQYQEIDDQLSNRVFDNLFERLDSKHRYFLASDIEHFSPWRTRLDNSIRIGELSIIQSIHQRYVDRYSERLDYAITLLEQKNSFDFNRQEWLDLNTNNQWSSSNDEINDLWRRIIKNQLLEKMTRGQDLDQSRQELLAKYKQQKTEPPVKNSEQLSQFFINIVAAEFDPHSEFMSPVTQQNFDIQMSHALEGIGAELSPLNNHIVVTKILPKGPADLEGSLQVNDQIIAVDQYSTGYFKSVDGWSVDQVVRLIRGPTKTSLTLKIKRTKPQPNEFEVTLTRARIKLLENAISGRILDLPNQNTRIGVITIPSFYIDFDAMQSGDEDFSSASRDFKNTLLDLTKQGIDGLLIDLRDNGGGSLREANLITGMLIDAGPIVQVKLPNGYVELFRDLEFGMLYDGPMVVMVNRMSASASEILAAALQDYGRALVVGDTTFGKGTVQTLTPMEYGQFKLTQAKFYRISGDSTQLKGVIPDLELPSLYDVEQTGEASLRQAMPWDSIDAVLYAPVSYTGQYTGPLVHKLSTLHYQRVNNSAEINFARELSELEKATQYRQRWPLNMADRKALYLETEQQKEILLESFQQEIGIENIDLQKDFESIVELLDKRYLETAAQVLVDWVELANTPIDQQLTAASVGFQKLGDL